MVGFVKAPPSADSATTFPALLPHSIFVDTADEVLLLETPKRWPWKPTCALGMVWAVETANVEVCDESVCLDMSRIHEGMLRPLPVGAALQVFMLVQPAHASVPWSQLRRAVNDLPLVQAQERALADGLPHLDRTRVARLRQIQTFVTLRVPLTLPVDPLRPLLESLPLLATQDATTIAGLFATHLRSATQHLKGYGAGIEEALRRAGHQVTRLAGKAVQAALETMILPTRQTTSPWIPQQRLSGQVLEHAAISIEGGWRFLRESTPLDARMLTLHRSAPKTYPGILSAPRAPEGTVPLSLWEVWDGPLAVVVNIAIKDQAKERGTLQRKRTQAFLQRLNPFGDVSTNNQLLKDELDVLLRTIFQDGTQLHGGTLHVVVWGPEETIGQGLVDLQQAARRLDLELLTETTLGSTLFVTALPLGYDPEWPQERVLRRARRLPGAVLADLMPLYGSFRGTQHAYMLYVNQRQEVVTLDPFDMPTNANMTVNGGSGAGKSFLTTHMAQSMLPLGAQMVILDRHPSYRELCEYWEGHYYDINFNNPPCFNIFHGPLDKAHQAAIVAFLAELASSPNEPLMREPMVALVNAVSHFAETWEAARGEPSLSPFVEEVLKAGGFAPNEPRLRRFGRELARKLGLFYGDGLYSGFVDGPNTVSLHPRLTVVEISQIEKAPDLQRGLFLALLYLVQQTFNDPQHLARRKAFITDETWKLIQNKESGDVVEEVARTIRKFNAMAMFISQYGNDFASVVGEVLRKSTSIKFFLAQDASELPVLATLFQFTPDELARFRQVRRQPGWSSAFVQLPNQQGGYIRLIPDAHTRWMASQDHEERQLRLEARARHGGKLQAAIAELAERYPYGLRGALHG